MADLEQPFQVRTESTASPLTLTRASTGDRTGAQVMESRVRGPDRRCVLVCSITGADGHRRDCAAGGDQSVQDPDPADTAGACGDCKLDIFICVCVCLTSALAGGADALFQVAGIGRESMVWFNAFSGRMYRDATSSILFREWFSGILFRLMNKGSKPGYIDEFQVSVRADELIHQKPFSFLRSTSMYWLTPTNSSSYVDQEGCPYTPVFLKPDAVVYAIIPLPCRSTTSASAPCHPCSRTPSGCRPRRWRARTCTMTSPWWQTWSTRYDIQSIPLIIERD